MGRSFLPDRYDCRVSCSGGLSIFALLLVGIYFLILSTSTSWPNVIYVFCFCLSCISMLLLLGLYVSLLSGSAFT